MWLIDAKCRANISLRLYLANGSERKYMIYNRWKKSAEYNIVVSLALAIELWPFSNPLPWHRLYTSLQIWTQTCWSILVSWTDGTLFPDGEMNFLLLVERFAITVLTSLLLVTTKWYYLILKYPLSLGFIKHLNIVVNRQKSAEKEHETKVLSLEAGMGQ